MTRHIYRHGDVNLVEVSPQEFAQAKKRGRQVSHQGRVILARGEATGSVHELSVTSPEQMELVQDGDTLWLRLSSSGTLTHTSDHATLTEIAPTTYRQLPEREMDHFAESVIRRVVD